MKFCPRRALGQERSERHRELATTHYDLCACVRACVRACVYVCVRGLGLGLMIQMTVSADHVFVCQPYNQRLSSPHPPPPLFRECGWWKGQLLLRFFISEITRNSGLKHI